MGSDCEDAGAYKVSDITARVVEPYRSAGGHLGRINPIFRATQSPCDSSKRSIPVDSPCHDTR